MNQLYRELILDHYKNPRNLGKLSKPSSKADEDNLSCGDSTHVELKVKNGKLTEIKHKTEGCAVAVASASILSEELVGMKVKEINKFDENDIIEMFGTKLTTSRMACAMLPLKAIQKALTDLTN